MYSSKKAAASFDFSGTTFDFGRWAYLLFISSFSSVCHSTSDTVVVCI